MNPDDKYISLNLAKKIYEAAKKMKVVLPWSEHSWRILWHDEIKKDAIALTLTTEIDTKEYSDWGIKAIPAYDCAELGEMLPPDYQIEGKQFPYELMIEKYPDRWQIAYVDAEGDGATDYIEAENEAEARGEMYLYLIENNLIPTK